MLDNDPIYQACIAEALKSPCQKKGVGAVLVSAEHTDATRGHTIIAREHNRPIEGMESLCQPTCIRLRIASRTESMLGSCGHAEERLLWDVTRRGYLAFMPQLSLYVAGVTDQKVPERRPFPEFTCLRCAVAMHYADLGAIYVAYQGNSWVRQTPQEALASAL